MTAPAMQRLGGAVLITTAPALAELRHTLALGARTRERRDGYPQSAGMRELLGLLSEAIAECEMSRPRHGDVAPVAALEDSEEMGTLEELSTAQASALLGVGRRQTQRLAGEIGGRKVPGGALVFHRGAVEAHAALRQHEDTHD